MGSRDAFVSTMDKCGTVSSLFPFLYFAAVRICLPRQDEVPLEKIAVCLKDNADIEWQILPSTNNNVLVIVNARQPNPFADYFARRNVDSGFSGEAFVGISQGECAGLEGLYAVLCQSKQTMIAHLLNQEQPVIIYDSAMDEIRKPGNPLGSWNDSNENINEAIRRALSDTKAIYNATPAELERWYSDVLLNIHNLQNTQQSMSEYARPLTDFESIDAMRDHLLEYLNSVGERKQVESSVVEKAAEYIREHCAEAVSVRDIADANYMNYTYFSELFKKQMGVTITYYLTDVRMKQALRLLKLPGARLEDVALAVGYKSAKTFSQAFRRHTGVSPKSAVRHDVGLFQMEDTDVDNPDADFE